MPWYILIFSPFFWIGLHRGQENYYTESIVFKKESFILIELDLVLQNLSEEKKQVYLSSQHLKQMKCPSPYENYLCVLRTYNGIILTNLVDTLDLSNDKTYDSQKIPIVSEIILHKQSIKGQDIKYADRSFLGIGFLNGNFK